MDDAKERKREIRDEMIRMIKSLSQKEVAQKTEQLTRGLFSFANFKEANIVLMYSSRESGLDTDEIIKKSLKMNKIVVLPAFSPDKREMTLMKIDNPNTDLVVGPRGVAEPDAGRCKNVPIDCIDIAIIPGFAFDEKGGRLGSGEGYYDRLMPKLPITTRKVALAYESQVIQQVPMESHDKYVDIIITEDRIIYKI